MAEIGEMEGLKKLRGIGGYKERKIDSDAVERSCRDTERLKWRRRRGRE